MTFPVVIALTLVFPTLSAMEPDSVGNSHILKEVQVKSISRRTLGLDVKSGQIKIDGRKLGDEASLLASPDAISFIRSMPAVATSNDLQASVSVRGGNAGDNRFMADAIPVFNPVHMLGLFSSYNPAFFHDYSFMPGRISATIPSAAAGLFQARSLTAPDTVLNGSLSVGLIESHGALNIPLIKGKSSVSVGARKTYLDLVFPKLLTLRNSTINYGVEDFNVAAVWQPEQRNLFRFSALFTKDDMGIDNGEVERDGKMGWGNFGVGMEWLHNNMETSMSFSRFHNRFILQEGGSHLNLPSSISLATARFLMKNVWCLDWETDVHYAHSSGQTNTATAQDKTQFSNQAWGWNTGLSYNRPLGPVHLDAGMRLSLYNSPHFVRLYPLPRLNLSWGPNYMANLFAAYSRTMAFEHLIQESSVSLPADFWVCSDSEIPPLDSHNFEVGVTGFIPLLRLTYSVEGYYRKMNNMIEFTGSLLDLTNASYNPISDVAKGQGYALGVSLSLLKQVGAVRGRLGYNLGTSRMKMEKFGNKWIPSSVDRLHDLSATLTWQPVNKLTFSGIFTHATGLPYTRAKYGYMINENLICEYFPHNSSRLPAYNRLDIAAGLTLTQKAKSQHIIRLSVYNVTASRNVLFIYTSYSLKDGIETNQAVMKNVIPSISYTYQF